MKKLFVFALIILFAGSITMPAQINNDAPGKPQTRRMGRQNFIKQLNLTADQQKQLQDIRYQLQKKMIDSRSQMQKNRLEIQNMLANNNVDEKKLLDLTEANSKIQAEMKTNAVQSWLAGYKILNPDQKEIWTKHFRFMGMGMRTNFMNMRRRSFNGRMQGFNRMGNRFGLEEFDENSPQFQDNNELLGINSFGNGDCPFFDQQFSDDLPDL